MRTCWVVTGWLVAVWGEVPTDEARRWWNLKDTDALDLLIDSSEAVLLGQVATCGCQVEPPSPARRVFELLYHRGTLPADFTQASAEPWVIPLLDAELRAALLDAYKPRINDFAILTGGDPDELAAFLNHHLGARVLTTARGEISELQLDNPCSS